MEPTNRRPSSDICLPAPSEDQLHVAALAGQGPVLEADEVGGVLALARVQGNVADLTPGPDQSDHTDAETQPMKGQCSDQ